MINFSGAGEELNLPDGFDIPAGTFTLMAHYRVQPVNPGGYETHVYVDGEEAQSPADVPNDDQHHHIVISHRAKVPGLSPKDWSPRTPKQWTGGKLEDRPVGLRIYNRALTPEEIPESWAGDAGLPSLEDES